MRVFVVVELDPVTDCAARMSQALEAMAMHALFFQRPDQTLHHTVLLRSMRRYKLLLQTVAAHKFGVCARREDQPIIAAKKEWRIDFAQRSEPGDQRVFKS